MSFPDETAPAEEAGAGAGAGSQSGAGAGGVGAGGKADSDVWSEADSAAVDAAAEAGLGGDADAGGDGADDAPADPMTVLTRERDEYLSALQRTQADFENFKKRVSRTQGEELARASSKLIDRLLPVLDTLDLAQAHQNEASAESEDAKALRAARSMLLDTLAKEGLDRVDEAEVAFDPAVHDAVARSEGDGSDSEVVVEEVLRSGYRWKGQVLRPAMVRVRG
jgi:molecular chaperone GrpE